jgi:hypothetical protein
MRHHRQWRSEMAYADFRAFPMQAHNGSGNMRALRPLTQGTAIKEKLASLRTLRQQHGGIGYVFLWLLGVPIPVLILISLLRGFN